MRRERVFLVQVLDTMYRTRATYRVEAMSELHARKLMQGESRFFRILRVTETGLTPSEYSQQSPDNVIDVGEAPSSKRDPMRRSRARRKTSRDVQVIIRDGGSSKHRPKPRAKTFTRSTQPRYGSKVRGPRRSWRGPGPKVQGARRWGKGGGFGGGLTRKSGSRRDPSPADIKHLSAKALVKLLKQAVRSGNERLAETIGQELDKRAARLGY